MNSMTLTTLVLNAENGVGPLSIQVNLCTHNTPHKHRPNSPNPNSSSTSIWCAEVGGFFLLGRGVFLTIFGGS